MRARGLRASAGLELAAGAAVSIGLTHYAAHRVGAPLVLQVLFGGWVLLPFLALAAGFFFLESGLARRALEVITPIVAIVSVAVYAAVALGSARPKTAIFVLVAPASLIVIAAAVATTALLSGDSPARR